MYFLEKKMIRKMMLPLLLIVSLGSYAATCSGSLFCMGVSTSCTIPLPAGWSCATSTAAEYSVTCLVRDSAGNFNHTTTYCNTTGGGSGGAGGGSASPSSGNGGSGCEGCGIPGNYCPVWCNPYLA